jgi:hypothetical protein
MALHGTVVWLLWLEHNNAVFNDIKWTRAKMIQKEWLGLIDYGHMDWERNRDKDDGKFENRWYRNGFLAKIVERKPRWKLTAASNGFDVH